MHRAQFGVIRCNFYHGKTGHAFLQNRIYFHLNTDLFINNYCIYSDKKRTFRSALNTNYKLIKKAA